MNDGAHHPYLPRRCSADVASSVGPIWRRLATDFLLTILLAIGLGLILGLLYLETYDAHSPYHGFDWVDRPAVGAAAIVIGYAFMRAIGRAVGSYLKLEGNQQQQAVVGLFFNLLIGIGVLLVLLDVAQVPIQSLFLGSALAGVVLGLAGQTLLGNVFAGVTIVLWGPFHIGDRVGVVSSLYGALAPSYPHELLYPTYTGTVTGIGLLYTVLRLDNGRVAKLPNSVLLQALVVNMSQSPDRMVRIRMTLPNSVPIPAVEAALEELSKVQGLLVPDRPGPLLEVSDLAAGTWDATVLVWTAEPSEERVRSEVLRTVMRTLPGAVGTGAKP